MSQTSVSKLAFVGPQRSGKSATSQAMAESLVEEGVAMVASFSGGVLSELFRGLVSASGRMPDKMLIEGMHQMYLQDKEVWRPLVVAYGMWKRHYNSNYWVEVFDREVTDAMRYIESGPKPLLGVFVDDCRFPNEYDYLIQNGYTFIRLNGNPDEYSNNAAESMTQEPERHQGLFPTVLTLPWVPVEERVEMVWSYLNDAN